MTQRRRYWRSGFRYTFGVSFIFVASTIIKRQNNPTRR